MKKQSNFDTNEICKRRACTNLLIDFANDFYVYCWIG